MALRAIWPDVPWTICCIILNTCKSVRRHVFVIVYLRQKSSSDKIRKKTLYWSGPVNIKRLLHDMFHIGPGISPRLTYQARQRSWSADMGRGLIPGTIWKISCHNLFITYYTLTFSKHWLFYCKKDLWTDKLRK